MKINNCTPAFCVLDFEKSIHFYTEIFTQVGARVDVLQDKYIVIFSGETKLLTILRNTFNGAPPTVANGSQMAFSCGSRETVDAMYKKALELGGTSEGAPGIRFEGGPYVAYFRDLTGHKLALAFSG